MVILLFRYIKWKKNGHEKLQLIVKLKETLQRENIPVFAVWSAVKLQ